MALRKYNVVSLFSGAMGLDIGLETTGRFKVIACVEVVPAFCETIRANKKAGRLSRNLNIYETDICNLDPQKVLDDLGLKPEEVDLLVGGPPCQSFSTAGSRRTTQDPRGTLLWQFLRFVDVMRPRFFLMENVRGLLSAALRHRPIAKRPEKGGPPLEPDEEPGSVIKLFAEDLQNLKGNGYHMDCFEVNAVNYGAPQLRERVIFIGNRYNTVVDFPDPTHGPQIDVNKQLTFFENTNIERKPWRTLRDAIGDLPENSQAAIMDFSPRKKSFLEMVPEGSNWRSLPVEVQKQSMGRAWLAKGGRSGWWRRLTFDLPCPTLVTMPNHASTSLCHPKKTRALTVREYARIQEFPDEWIVCGKTSEQYAQIGNAVPVRLGRVAGEVIASQLDVLRKKGWKKKTRKPESFRIIYVQSHVRTRQWFRAGETFLWKDGKKNGHAEYKPMKTLRRSAQL